MESKLQFLLFHPSSNSSDELEKLQTFRITRARVFLFPCRGVHYGATSEFDETTGCLRQDFEEFLHLLT
jgi:hypothetical protein